LEKPHIKKTRASSSEDARAYRQRGHDDALDFALSIGLDSDYNNDLQAKKDVIDLSGDAHSVKSGKKKWQVFLYGVNRFRNDAAFGAMNGIGDLLIECIESFPETFRVYQSNKMVFKQKLRVPMRKLAERLQDKRRLKAFINKALFNGGEVNYLTIKHEEVFHVFLNKDVIRVFAENLEVSNSRAITISQVPEQKVLFRYEGLNLGELEMRNDSETHYREIRFNMLKPKVLRLLFGKIELTKKLSKKVFVYGDAKNKFGRWKKK